MKYAVVVVVGTLVSVASGCIDAESGRPYAEFVAEVESLADAGGLPDSSSGPDLASMPDAMPPNMTLPPAERCSVDGPALNVEFSNETGVDGTVYWVDHGCEQISYGDLAAGARRPQGTFEGHVWRLYGANLELLGEVVVAGPDGSVLSFQ